jgi:hypothetical protein
VRWTRSPRASKGNKAQRRRSILRDRAGPVRAAEWEVIPRGRQTHCIIAVGASDANTSRMSSREARHRGRSGEGQRAASVIREASREINLGRLPCPPRHGDRSGNSNLHRAPGVSESALTICAYAGGVQFTERSEVIYIRSR